MSWDQAKHYGPVLGQTQRPTPVPAPRLAGCELGAPQAAGTGTPGTGSS